MKLLRPPWKPLARDRAVMIIPSPDDGQGEGRQGSQAVLLMSVAQVLWALAALVSAIGQLQ